MQVDYYVRGIELQNRRSDVFEILELAAEDDEVCLSDFLFLSVFAYSYFNVLSINEEGCK